MTRRRLLILAFAAALAIPLALYAAEQTQSFANNTYVRSPGLGGSPQQQLAQRVLFTEVVALADGNGVTLDCRGMRFVTIVTASGATATYSKVDAMSAVAHDTATDATIAASTDQALNVNWPFMRVSVAGGAARVAVVP